MGGERTLAHPVERWPSAGLRSRSLWLFRGERPKFCAPRIAMIMLIEGEAGAAAPDLGGVANKISLC